MLAPKQDALEQAWRSGRYDSGGCSQRWRGWRRTHLLAQLVLVLPARLQLFAQASVLVRQRLRQHVEANEKQPILVTRNRRLAPLRLRLTKQPQRGVIPHLSIPGTVPARYPEYPDPPRDGFLRTGAGRAWFSSTLLSSSSCLASRRSFSSDLGHGRHAYIPHVWARRVEYPDPHLSIPGTVPGGYPEYPDKTHQLEHD